MKTMIQLIYKRGGVQYRHVMPNVPNGSIETEALKSKIGISEIVSWKRIQVKAE